LYWSYTDTKHRAASLRQQSFLLELSSSWYDDDDDDDNWHVDYCCELPFSRYSRSNGKSGVWQAKNGPHTALFWLRIWWPLKISPPLGEKQRPTIVQNLTPIGGIVAEISVPGQKYIYSRFNNQISEELNSPRPMPRIITDVHIDSYTDARNVTETNRWQSGRSHAGLNIRPDAYIAPASWKYFYLNPFRITVYGLVELTLNLIDCWLNGRSLLLRREAVAYLKVGAQNLVSASEPENFVSVPLIRRYKIPNLSPQFGVHAIVKAN